MIALPLTRGQRLWFVPAGPWDGKPRYVTVARVGTRYAYLDGYDGMACDRETATLGCDLQGRVGTLYASKKDHADTTSVRKAWGHLSKLVRERSMFGRMPQGLTHADVEQARKLLKLEAP